MMIQAIDCLTLFNEMKYAVDKQATITLNIGLLEYFIETKDKVKAKMKEVDNVRICGFEENS